MQIQRQQSADDVSADVVGRGRNHIYHSVECHAQLTARVKAGIGHNRGVGRSKYRPCVQLQKEVDHGGVAGKNHGGAAGGVDSGTLCQFRKQGIKGLHRRTLKLCHVGGIFHGIGNTGEYVRAEGDLPVHSLCLINDTAGVHVNKRHHNGGRAVVHSQPVVLGTGVTGFHISDDPVTVSENERYGNIKVRVPAQGIKLPKHLQRQGNALIAEGFQSQTDSFFITDGNFFCGHLQL